MIDRTAIPCARIATEGVAIVLAFAIDAAWEQRTERQQERAILVSSAVDFKDTDAELARR